MSTTPKVPLNEQDSKGVEWAVAALLADWKQARADLARMEEQIDQLVTALRAARDSVPAGLGDAAVKIKINSVIRSVGREP